MTVTPVSSTATTPEAAGTSLEGQAFLTLLVAQLKTQDPLHPMNPTEYVNQLVQFNLLEQTLRIRVAIEALAAAQVASPAPEGAETK